MFFSIVILTPHIVLQINKIIIVIINWATNEEAASHSGCVQILSVARYPSGPLSPKINKHVLIQTILNCFVRQIMFF